METEVVGGAKLSWKERTRNYNPGGPSRLYNACALPGLKNNKERLRGGAASCLPSGPQPSRAGLVAND